MFKNSLFYKKLRYSPWLPALVVWFLGIWIAAIMIVGSSKAIKLLENELPNLEKIIKIEINITLAHIWIEEIYEWNAPENINKVWLYIDKAEKLTNSIIGSSLDDSKFEIHSNALLLQENVKELKTITLERMKNPEFSKTDSVIVLKQNKNFREILSLTDEIRNIMLVKKDVDIADFMFIRVLILTLVIGLIGLLGLVILIYNKRNLQNFKYLENSFKKLKHAKEEIDISEKRFRSYIDNAPNGVFVADLKGNFIDFNQAAALFSGYSDDELYKMKISDIIPKSELEKVQNQMIHITTRGTTTEQYQIIKKDGSLSYCSVSGVKLAENRLLGFVVDITERKKAEDELRESESLIKTFVSNVNGVVFIVDQNGIFRLSEGRGLSELGLKPGEVVGMSVYELYKEVPQIEIEIKKTIEGYERTAVIPVGYQTYEVNFVPLNGNGGEVTGVLGVALDITERKKAEDLIKTSEERYKNFISQLTEGIYRFELEEPMDINKTVEEQIDFMYEHLIIAECNPTFMKMYGINDIEEIIGKSQKELHGSTDNSANRLVIREFIKSGYKTENKITEEIDAKGNKKYFSNNAIGIIKNNQLVRMWGTQTDITEQKIAESALKESEKKYRLLAENSLDFIWELDMDLNIVYASNVVNDVLGFTVDEIMKMNVKDLYNPDELKKIEKVINEEVKKGPPHHGTTFEAMHLHKNGEEFPVEINGKIIFDHIGTPVSLQGYTRDISERKKNMSALIQAKEEAEKANRLKSIFLTQMSHEIRTPINAIVSLSSLLQEDLEDKADEDQKISFEMVNRAGIRIIRTVDLLLNLSEIQAGTYEIILKKFDIYSDILGNILVEYRKNAKDKNLNINVNIETDDREVIADSYTTSQIFTQLIDNAIKYSEQGEINVKLFRNEKERMVVEIIDSGVGIEKEYLPNLFDPFSQEQMGYTRKYEGNGIGLTLVKKYCEMNKADIEVESQKGKGSTFRVIF